MSKAFDRVWHRGLLFKLRQNGIDGKLLQWLNSYLTNRKQKVTLKSCASTIKSILAGVPQGSVLGPLLFLVYINDIAKQLLSLTRLFADDSSLFYAAARLSDIAGIINHDLIMLSNWAIQWLVKFNPLKTEAVLFTLKYFEAFPQLIFDNTPIKFVEDHKHVGITFSQNGQWHTHIEQIANIYSVENIRHNAQPQIHSEQKCIKPNLFKPFITHHRVCIISLGWLHTTRLEHSTKDTK